MKTVKRGVVGVMLAVAGLGCGTPGEGLSDGGAEADGGAALDSGSACARVLPPEDMSACAPGANDYQPRDGVPGDDGWPACISDDGVFHPLGTGIPAASARTLAFDSMAAKLWDNPAPPTAADFLSARDDYSVAQGLASRVARRQDVSYPEVPGGDKFACQADPSVPAQYPDRCAGPARLKPTIDAAFVSGANGEKPRVQAARIEAALLWFLHLSMTSEVWTCSFDKTSDCDAAAGYYAAELTQTPATGFGRYVARTGPETHARIFDALLAVRCWRDADTALPASRTDLYEAALEQLDRASLRGIALAVAERLEVARCAEGEAREAALQFVQVLGGFLVHAAESRDAATAARWAAFAAAPDVSTESAVQAAQADLGALFSCP
jgi:hypothetical protein